ncbi:MAG: hypothetical protein ACD_30C00042G0018 [uncultured bacterium]|uniref:Uncharacterized protein n=4 Tax=Candidatus Daviesiibacteriota TaxID=1752718 RepID=A0A0G0HVP9_9BACT|nr:MAG: hypothetical protein ACD_30C00042G0018 [uncultured bacterium]KKQ07971.1 MAG: hypothetical protein US19_C0034G0007 [Candidatus Daviesbacteria bacterium GW2011_GWB1_36_5]KKQ16088.1 MAG: hypothetical protein US28_C0005G0003 [Candidatus Daviesbacteria bacterium GW2011_GWA1_36_8]OGE17328.1 MAG: hypothetical protein A2858_03245 [Candidatus Daviesbacteria bacterium RIFCSPHIGHO2_01_FULL_36_37]OGE32223.1 MAG: hypothetical protein A3C99_02615 [Candidatus Daviesbacteria bacterium RIFCSPHIGHO2_02_F
MPERPELNRRKFIGVGLATIAGLFIPRNVHAQPEPNTPTQDPGPPEDTTSGIAAMPESEAAPVTMQDKALAFMHQKIKAEKLPQDANIKWSTDTTPLRTMVTGELSIQGEEDKRIEIGVYYMERPDGGFLQQQVSVRLFNTPEPIHSISPDRIQATISPYVNLEGINGDWTFYQGSRTVPSRTERTRKEGDVLYSEGVIQFGRNDNVSGNLRIQIAEHTKGTLEFTQGTGFATTLAQSG